MTLMELAQPTGLTDALVASSTSEGPATVVTLRGEADLCALPTIVEALSRAIADHDGAVIVDLTRTEFIDTRTMRALDRAWKLLDDRGRTLTLRSPSRVAVRVLTLLGLSHLIEPDRRRRSDQQRAGQSHQQP